MNYIKLQTDILKAKEAEDLRGKPSPFKYGLIDNYVGIIVNGSYLVLVPKCAFYLDFEKTFPKQVPIKIEQILKFRDAEDALPATDTGITRRIETVNKTIKVFTTEKADIWVDKDHFKYFGKDVTEYRGTEKNKPLYLFEYEVLVGMVLPVNHS